MKRCILVFVLITNILFFSSFEINAKNKSKPIATNTYAAIAIDADTGDIIYEKKCYEQIPMASTTKIMTSLIALNYGKLDEKVVISQKSARVSGCEIGYKKDEEVTLRELLYGLMLQSGNDAAVAIAEHIGGSIEGFSKIMNEYAATLGVNGASFESPHGLDSANHFCSAYDLAMITKEAMKNELFNQIVSTKSLEKSQSNFTRNYNNINKIIYIIPEATGVKTGYTGNAGRCLVSSFDLGSRKLIIVTLNSSTSEKRWQDTRDIFNYCKKKMSETVSLNYGQ